LDDLLLPPLLDFLEPPLAAFFVAILLTTFHAFTGPHGRASWHNSPDFSDRLDSEGEELRSVDDLRHLNRIGVNPVRGGHRVICTLN
jgi:hypothetical protein